MNTTARTTIEQTHDILFDLLCVVADLCDKHGIEYFLDSGTLLGAVRHKDFIPWDDDVDLTMKRSEFERFCAVADELPEHCRLCLPTDYNGYFLDFVVRVLDMRHKRHEDVEEDLAQNCLNNREAVDIFILDDAPADDSAFSRTVFRQKMIYGYAMGHRYNKKKHEHSLADKLKIGVLSTLGRLSSLDKIIKKQEKCSQKYRNTDCTHYWLSNTLVNELGIRYPKEYFASTVEFPIRDRMFSCPVGYHHTLTALYGDYMTPPPEKERHPTHADS